MACSTPSKSPLSELSPASPATNVFRFNLPFPVTAECEVGENPQEERNNQEESGENCGEVPMKVNQPDEGKEEILSRPCMTADNIIPQRRPRAYALDRTSNPQKY